MTFFFTFGSLLLTSIQDFELAQIKSNSCAIIYMYASMNKKLSLKCVELFGRGNFHSNVLTWHCILWAKLWKTGTVKIVCSSRSVLLFFCKQN